MDITLFLGSGVSRPTGLPDVGKLTEEVLDGQYHFHTDENFYTGQHPNPYYRSDDPTGRIQEFLKVLEQHQTDFLRRRTGRSVRANYEHLYHLADQLRRTVRGYDDNGAVDDFVTKMEAMVPPLFKGLHSHVTYDLGVTADRATDLIECVVWHRLGSSGKTVVGFDLLKELLTSGLVHHLYIVTLNHDLLVEEVLDEVGVVCVDGFGDPDGDVRWYEPIRFRKPHPKVRGHVGSGTKVTLVKPHGSLNWYYLDDGKQYNHGIPLTNDPDHLKGRKGVMYTNVGNRPRFLSGGTKEVTYHTGIYSDMQEVFLRALRNTKTVLMSGFGWQDLGISFRLATWLDRNPGKRVVLLHRDPDEIRSNSTGISPRRFDSFVKRDQLVVLKKWFSEATLAEVRPHLVW